MNNEREYYKLKWYKRPWYKLIDTIKQKIKNYHFHYVRFIIFVVACLIVLSLVLIISKGTIKFPVKAMYDKTGYVDVNEIDKTTIVKENERYIFSMNLKTSHIKITDKVTLQTYSSAPNSTEDVDTLTLYYSGSLGVPVTYGNYKYSINYEGSKHFLIKEEENSVNVLYEIGGKVKIDYTDIPQMISEERFNYFIGVVEKKMNETNDEELKRKYRLGIRRVQSTYSLNEIYRYYALDNPSSLGEDRINDIYDFLYNDAGYTKDDLEKDCLENDIVIDKTYPTFEVAISYILTTDGLDVKVINESIVDYESHPLAYIDVLPYFGSVDENINGYSLIPDGSGIILDYNTNRSYANRYEERIYGRDLAVPKETGGYKTNKINFGVYGMCYFDNEKSNGFISIIKDGAAACSVVATINTSSTRATTYNTTYYRFYYRETDTYQFTSLSGVRDIQTWTNDYNKVSLELKYVFLSDDATYASMAKSYQKYLVDNKMITKLNENKLDFNLTLLGGYLKDTYFLGIPYKKVASLTNDQEVLKIAQELKNDQINNLNIIYSGFLNDGIESKYISKIKYNNVIASKKDLKKLNKALNDLNISLYPKYNLATGVTDKNIKSNDMIRDLYGKVIKEYPISEVTFTADKSLNPSYYVKPDCFTKGTKKVLTSIDKLLIDKIAIGDLGNKTYGSYKNKEIMFRTDMVKSYLSLMEENFNNYNVMTDVPNDYALKYTSVASNIPFDGTNYQIVQSSVPFYQLVLSGYVNYSGISINLSDEHSFDYYKMKSIETLSDISMTWTYQNTIDLIDTEYNYYYSTYYKNWYEKGIKLYKELDELSLYDKVLVNHQILTLNGEVAISTYSDGSKIIFNYSNSDYSYDGLIIKANSYKKLGGV